MEALTIKIRYRDYKASLTLDNKITVIVGLSATGKSTLHKALEVKDKTRVIQLSNDRFEIIYLSDMSILHGIIKDDRLDPYKIYLIDEGRIDIDNDIASVIKRTRNSYFIITARTKLGKLNFALDAVKHLITDDNGVTKLQNYMEASEITLSRIKSTNIDEILIEDSGQAKEWFNELLAPLYI